jgi:Proteasome-substrate-size regulator, mid region
VTQKVAFLVFKTAKCCRWSGSLAAFLESMHTQLISRRLVREATDYWTGDVSAVKLDIPSVRPVAEVLYSMASVAVFHKDESLSEVAPAAVAALSCVLPEKCLPFVVRTIHETLASAEAVHRTVDAISLFAGAMLHNPETLQHAKCSTCFCPCSCWASA